MAAGAKCPDSFGPRSSEIRWYDKSGKFESSEEGSKGGKLYLDVEVEGALVDLATQHLHLIDEKGLTLQLCSFLSFL